MPTPQTHRYRILSEPRGDAYRDLLSFCAEVAGRCSLEDYKARTVRAFLDTIEPYCVERIADDRVPLSKHRQATQSTGFYAVTPELIARLQEAVPGLYGWQRPKLPASLRFYRSGETLLLETTPQFRIGWLNLTDEERRSNLLGNVELRLATPR